MIRVLFFAHLREAFGAGESMVLVQGVHTVAGLRDQLAARGDAW